MTVQLPKEDSKELRARVYEMRKAGSTWNEVAAATGLGWDTARNYYRIAVSRDGLPKLAPDLARRGWSKTIEREQETEKVEQMVVAALAADAPLSTKALEKSRYAALRQACHEAGIAPKIANDIVKRLNAQAGLLSDADRMKLTTQKMIEVSEEKLGLIAAYMDEFTISQAGLKELAIAWDTMVKNRQLLMGQPTANIDFTMRMQLDELVPAMLAEAKRRGLLIEGESRVVTAEEAK